MSEQRIVSASGIRGVVGRGLDPGTVARYGAAFGAFLRGRREEGTDLVLVARDTRTSGPAFADAAAAGLRATGWDVRDLGVCPTPTALLAVGEEPRAAAGVVVTASHNPPEWNGLKLISSTGRFLGPEEGRAVQALFEEGPEYAPWTEMGGREEASGALARHRERILALDLLHRDRVSAARPFVVVDAGGGTGSLIVPALLEELGCRVTGMNVEPTGRFPRPPEPTAENLGALGERVRREGADVGMATDPDGDRLALVDETGRAVGEDWTLTLAVELVASRVDGPVVTNLSTSQSVEDAAERHGARVHRTPVGEANVAWGMDRWRAPIGGEGNGGVMLAALHLTRDAPLAAALVAELLAERKRTVGELIGQWPGYHMLRWKGPRPERPLEEVYDDLEEAAPGEPAVDRQDGLRLAWPAERRWVHVRPSGTEPVVRVIGEAPDREEAEEMVSWARLGLAG